MSTAFGIELPLRRLFESPTVASLAAWVVDFARHEPLQASPISRAPRDGELPLSFAQERLWFLHQLEPENPFTISRAFSPNSAASLTLAVAEHVLNEIVRRHEVLRTRCVSTRGEAGQVIATSETIRITLIDLQANADPQEGAAAMEEEARCPFDLERGPLLRATLLRLEPREHVLLMTLHHIVSDGWSMGVLAREMSACTACILPRGRRSPLPELAIQCGFTVWQRAWLSGPILEKQLSYWKEREAGAPAVLKLPTDRPRALISDFAAK